MTTDAEQSENLTWTFDTGDLKSLDIQVIGQPKIIMVTTCTCNF